MADTPHGERPPVSIGADLGDAEVAVIALHGRGATARSVLRLVAELDVAGVAGIAPQASRNTWYPNRFMEPIEDNEPWLSAALGVVADTVDRVADAGVPVERSVLLGFSQGACLAAEFAARNARRYGGLVAFSGGLIGPPETPRDYGGSLEGTPAFVGCSDSDPHIPVERVEETAAVLGRLGAEVTMELYRGMPHTVNEDELAAARMIVEAAAGA